MPISHDLCQRAVFPGTFDPITEGHLDIVKRALCLFPEIIIAVAPNPKKSPLFSLEERLSMIRAATAGMEGLLVREFEGLLVHFLRHVGATAIIRGVRAISDFEFESQMAMMNRTLHPDVETVFLIPNPAHAYISSSLIKEVAGYGGDVSAFVHKTVAQKLREKYPPAEGGALRSANRVGGQ
jgi:pantetheine-phosphate adenylyltransferase